MKSLLNNKQRTRGDKQGRPRAPFRRALGAPVCGPASHAPPPHQHSQKQGRVKEGGLLRNPSGLHIPPWPQSTDKQPAQDEPLLVTTGKQGKAKLAEKEELSEGEMFYSGSWVAQDTEEFRFRWTPRRFNDVTGGGVVPPSCGFPPLSAPRERGFILWCQDGNIPTFPKLKYFFLFKSQGLHVTSPNGHTRLSSEHAGWLAQTLF